MAQCPTTAATTTINVNHDEDAKTTITASSSSPPPPTTINPVISTVPCLTSSSSPSPTTSIISSLPDIAHHIITSYLTMKDVHCMMETNHLLMEVYGGRVKDLGLVSQDGVSYPCRLSEVLGGMDDDPFGRLVQHQLSLDVVLVDGRSGKTALRYGQTMHYTKEMGYDVLRASMAHEMMMPEGYGVEMTPQLSGKDGGGLGFFLEVLMPLESMSSESLFQLVKSLDWK